MKTDYEILFCPLGGSGEIGANMNLYGFGKSNHHKGIIVDCGITFAQESLPGIDVIIPDPDFIYQKKKELSLLLSHLMQQECKRYFNARQKLVDM